MAAHPGYARPNRPRGRPTDVHEKALDHRARMACSLAAASGSHALIFLLLAIAIRGGASGGFTSVTPPTEIPKGLVWLRGIGGGGGGSGNGQTAPPQHIRRQGPDHASMPGPPPAPTTTSAREPDPIDRVTVPVQPIGDSLASVLGVVEPGTFASTSLGPGHGSNAGTGDGPGLGSGRGNGFNDGQDGGFGGGVFGPGASGVTIPVALHMERPSYTTDAMRARIQGVAVIECVVRPNGRCSDIRVARSLDPIFGLDEEAKRAVTLWRFKPGMYRGDPVPVIVRLELQFTIR